MTATACMLPLPGKSASNMKKFLVLTIPVSIVMMRTKCLACNQCIELCFKNHECYYHLQIFLTFVKSVWQPTLSTRWSGKLETKLSSTESWCLVSSSWSGRFAHSVTAFCFLCFLRSKPLVMNVVQLNVTLVVIAHSKWQYSITVHFFEKRCKFRWMKWPEHTSKHCPGS